MPATEVKSEAPPTVSKLASSNEDMGEESGHEDEDFMDDENQPTEEERPSFDNDLASATVSTARRAGAGKKILEEPK